MNQSAKHGGVVCEGHGERAGCPHHPQAHHDHASPARHASHGADHMPGEADKPHREHRDGPELACDCMAHSATGMLTITIDKVVAPKAGDVERAVPPVTTIRFNGPIPLSRLTDPPFRPPKAIHL